MHRTAAVAASLALALALASPKGVSADTVEGLRERIRTLGEARPPAVPAGTVTSLAYLVDTAERIAERYPTPSATWLRRADAFLREAEAGRDPYPAERGRITARGYRSPLSTVLQGYAIYLPPSYDPARAWPLMVVLHGGSSNGNLFLGVVLGNNMDWERYPQFLYDDFTPVWSPEWIVVAPTGFGQVMWRWMGERDVLDVIADVERHYRVDPDRVALAGLSNGGVGAYAIGARHASRFSVVQAMAGAPSWVQYTGGRPLPEERPLLEALSALHLAPNTTNTDFRYYHGRSDGGPMKPRFVTELRAELDRLGLRAQETWFDAGHDILYMVHRHGRIYPQLAEVRRNRSPAEVRLVSGDYRASRQHWVSVTRLSDPPSLGRVHARIDGSTLHVDTEAVLAFRLDLRDAPATTDPLRVMVDAVEVYRGPRAALGHALHVVFRDGSWQTGFPDEPAGALVKRPGLSGPLTDAYYERSVHVYGTLDPAATARLRAAAERGARGWPLWLWDFSQEVVPDTDVTDELRRSANLILYGNTENHRVLAELGARLPIRADGRAVTIGESRHEGRDLGARFIYPNPASPERYVVVQTGTTPEAVAAGHQLPDFVPDYVVYDGARLRSRPRLVLGPSRPVAIGYFDRHWQLRGAREPGSGSDGERLRRRARRRPHATRTYSTLPVPDAPPAPPAPSSFLAPARDPAGDAARRIARRVQRFPNFRAKIPGGSWRVDPEAVWQVRPEADCLAALRAAGVPFRGAAARVSTPVPTPVEITGRVGGVRFPSMHRGEPVLLACEFALRLPELARIVASHGVTDVLVASSYRTEPWVSFHTLGLGLDIAGFRTTDGRLSVLDDFVETPGHETCLAPPPEAPRARALREIACGLAATGRFASVLTPNYNEGHRDHFHLDARPDDPRLFVR